MFYKIRVLARPNLVNSIYRRRKFHKSKDLRLYGVYRLTLIRPGVGFSAPEPFGDQIYFKKSQLCLKCYIFWALKK